MITPQSDGSICYCSPDCHIRSLVLRENRYEGGRFEFLPYCLLDRTILVVTRVVLQVLVANGLLNHVAQSDAAQAVVFKQEQRMPGRVGRVLIHVNLI